MDWLTRLFTTHCTPDEARREQQTKAVVTMVDDLKRDLRADIDERKALRFPLDSVRLQGDDEHDPG